MKTYKNILFINFGGIGDEILFLPTIKSFKETYPNAKITLVLESRSKSIKDLTDLIDDLICIDIKSKNKLIELVKLYFSALFGRFDIVISSGSNQLIPILLFFTGIKERVGYTTGKFTEKLLTKAVPLNSNQYAGKMYHDLVKDITQSVYRNPDITINEVEKIQNSIIIHPGVSKMSIQKNIIKSWPNKVWGELAEALIARGKDVYIAGGPDDAECISEIREYLEKSGKKYNDMYGKTKNIKDLAKLIKQSETLICSDSAPMHIGIATNTKTIAIFGPTDENKLMPKSNNFIAIKTNVHCRPCLWDKRQTSCDDKKCLNIEIDQLLEHL